MAPVLSRNWSASVLLPWSMCAMIEKLRIRRGSVGMVRSQGSEVSGSAVVRHKKRNLHIEWRRFGFIGEYTGQTSDGLERIILRQGNRDVPPNASKSARRLPPDWR